MILQTVSIKSLKRVWELKKDEYLTELKKNLKKLPEEERSDILRDFEEYFQIGNIEGKTDEEIIAGLGSPQQMAKEFIASSQIEKLDKEISVKNLFGAVLAVFGLGFFNFVIVLFPFIGLLVVFFVGWFTSMAFIGSPLLSLFELIFFPYSFSLFEFFTSLLFCGIGLILAMGMYFLSKFFIKGLIWYLKFNVKLVKGVANSD